jgi:transposase
LAHPGVTDEIISDSLRGAYCRQERHIRRSPSSGRFSRLRDRQADWTLCLLAKRLERGQFIWPQATSGTVSLTQAQLSMLLEGIDWRRPVRSYAPQMAV